MPPRRRIVFLTIQTIGLFLLSLFLLVIAGVRTVFFNYCTDWLTCQGKFLPSLGNQGEVFEWLEHVSIIGIVVLAPILFILAIVVLRREDEAVMAGIRNTVVLFLVQSVFALAVSIVSIGGVWQAPALHFMTAALLLFVAIVIVGWALFSPNQDYIAPLFLGALAVVSIIPLVPYVSNTLRITG